MRNELAAALIILLAPGLWAQPASPSSAEGLDSLVAKLQENPADDALRAKIIALALKVKPKTPEDAKRHMGRAQAYAEMAASPNDYGKVVSEVDEALTAAPWLASAYYNKALALEKSADFAGAKANFNDYLLAAPGAANAEAVQQRIYKLEVLAETKTSAVRPGETVSKEDANTWRYEIDGMYKMHEVQREGGFKDYHGKEAFYVDTEINTSAAGTVINTTARTYMTKGKDGIYALGVETGVSGTTSETTYDPPMLFIPTALKKGQSWSYTGVQTISSGESGGGTTSSDVQSEVTGQERLTVPAGTFDCSVVHQKSKSHTTYTSKYGTSNTDGEVEMTYWMVPGIGPIKTTTRVIGSSTAPMNRILVEYKLPRGVWGWDVPPAKPVAADDAAKPVAADDAAKPEAAALTKQLQLPLPAAPAAPAPEAQ
jgi:hypothetical protein